MDFLSNVKLIVKIVVRYFPLIVTEVACPVDRSGQLKVTKSVGVLPEGDYTEVSRLI